MPPIPKKQKPVARVESRPSSNGQSLLSQVIDIEDLEDDHIKMVIYGQNRVGKTTLACKFPKPLLLIACEPNTTGGAKSVKKIPGVKYLRVTTTKEAIQLARELKTDNSYKTHVIDSATSLQDIVLQEILDLPEVPEMLSWGLVSMDQYRERSEKTREILRLFTNLHVDTVICAKERDHNPPKENRNKLTRGMRDESFFAADLGGATTGWLHDACDYIGRLYIDKEIVVDKRVVKSQGKDIERDVERETGRIVRRLRTMYHPNYAAGFRSCDPKMVPEFIEDPDYDKIAKVIAGVRI